MPWRGLMKMQVWHGLGFRWHSEVTCRKHREKALRCNGPHALPVIVSNVSIVDGSEVCVNRDRVLARLLASLGMRSEERRVGKEWRCRWWAARDKERCQ